MHIHYIPLFNSVMLYIFNYKPIEIQIAIKQKMFNQSLPLIESRILKQWQGF